MAGGRREGRQRPRKFVLWGGSDLMADFFTLATFASWVDRPLLDLPTFPADSNPEQTPGFWDFLLSP